MDTLKTSREFAYVYKNARKAHAPSFTLYALCPSHRAPPRLRGAGLKRAHEADKEQGISRILLGLSVSKKIGKAHVRNLLKRRVRAIVRDLEKELTKQIDSQLRAQTSGHIGEQMAKQLGGQLEKGAQAGLDSQLEKEAQGSALIDSHTGGQTAGGLDGSTDLIMPPIVEPIMPISLIFVPRVGVMDLAFSELSGLLRYNLSSLLARDKKRGKTALAKPNIG